MPLCYRCTSPTSDDPDDWFYCGHCGRHLCSRCARVPCCKRDVLIDDVTFRNTRRVQYRLQRVRREVSVSVECEWSGVRLGVLTAADSRRFFDLGQEFDWGNARLPLKWSPLAGACRALDYTWKGWTWYRSASEISKGTEQLAFALLLDYYRDEELARIHWQRFAFDVLIFAPRNGALVTRADFRNWHNSYTLRVDVLDCWPAPRINNTPDEESR